MWIILTARKEDKQTLGDEYSSECSLKPRMNGTNRHTKRTEIAADALLK
jgi:hypothetical protein